MAGRSTLAADGHALRTVATHCKICECRCGIEVTVEGNSVVRVAPDKQNPYTWRDFCAKARTAGEAIEHPRRLLAPMRRVGDRYVEATWEEAVTDIAARLRRIIDRGGPDAVAGYFGNPGYFSESNMLFHNGFFDAIESRSRYNVGSIDHNAYEYVCQEMYGNMLPFLVPDVDSCECFLLVGTNPAESAFIWVHFVPEGWRRILRAQSAGADVIVVDPRRTPTAEKADTHVALRPGTDWAFLLGVVKAVLDKGWEDAAAMAATAGADDLRALAAEADLEALARCCDVPADVMVAVAERFATATSAMCVSRTGVSQTLSGTVAEWLGHVLNVITGNLDRPGGRYFQPGYIDVAGFMGRLKFAPLTGNSRVRGLPPVGGGHALAELPGEITTPGPGQVRALFLNSGNPVVSGPDGRALDEAMAELDLLVVLDLVQRESHRHADWLLPVAHWLERDDLLWFFSSGQDQPYVQYGRRAVLPPPGAREEWRFFADLALEMKVPLFGKPKANTLLKVTRALARATRKPGLEFGPRWITRAAVAHGRKLRWKRIVEAEHGLVYGRREYGKFPTQVFTADGRVQLAPPALAAEARRLAALPPPSAPAGHPFQMVTRRRKDSMNSWLNDLPGLHTKSDKGNVVELHPDDAAGLGIADGDRVAVSSPLGRIELPARVTTAVRPGVVAVEHGWGSRVFDPRHGGEPAVFGANRNLLVANDALDPLSQTPALNSAWVALARAPAAP